MSDWQQVGDTYSTPVRTTPPTAVTITPASSDRNYYGNLPEYNYDTDTSRSISSSVPAILDTWEDEDVFWEGVRQERLQNTADLQEEVTFSSAPESIKLQWVHALPKTSDQKKYISFGCLCTQNQYYI